MYDDSPQPSRRWNLFARELEDILARHGFRLGHLDDRAQIYREKVARLQRSLREPKFHVLTPAELERIYDVFEFTAEDRLRVRAAILATAVEKMLMDRINANDALVAAEQILPIIVRVLRTHDGRTKGMGAVKGGMESWIRENGNMMENPLETALDYCDQGMIELHLSAGAQQLDDQIVHARQAHAIFIAALAMLEQSDLAVKNTDRWITWHQEIQSGLAAANTRLVILGV